MKCTDEERRSISHLMHCVQRTKCTHNYRSLTFNKFIHNLPGMFLVSIMSFNGHYWSTNVSIFPDNARQRTLKHRRGILNILNLDLNPSATVMFTILQP